MKKVLYVGLDPSHCHVEGEITHLPLIKIVPRPIDAVRKAFEKFQSSTHVILTSKSAVQIMANYLPYFGYTVQNWVAKVHYVVGQVTAEHLQKCGIGPVIIAKEETAEGLLKEIDPSKHQMSHFFWPHSALSRPIISEFFQTHRLLLNECILYGTYSQLPEEPIDLNLFDEVIFTSPSTVKSFLEAFGSFPSHLQLTAIGPVTSDYLQTVVQRKFPTV